MTSSDDHDAHDILMISYIVLNIPWMIGGLMVTPVEALGSAKMRFVVKVPFVRSFAYDA